MIPTTNNIYRALQNATQTTNTPDIINIKEHVTDFFYREIKNHTGNNLDILKINPTEGVNKTDFCIFERFNDSIMHTAVRAKEAFLSVIHDATTFNADFMTNIALPAENLLIEIFKSMDKTDYLFVKECIRGMLNHKLEATLSIYNFVLYSFPVVFAKIATTGSIDLISYEYIASVLMSLTHKVPLSLVIATKLTFLDHIFHHFPLLLLGYDYSVNMHNYSLNAFNTTLTLFGAPINMGTVMLSTAANAIANNQAATGTTVAVLGTGYVGYRVYITAVTFSSTLILIDQGIALISGSYA